MGATGYAGGDWSRASLSRENQPVRVPGKPFEVEGGEAESFRQPTGLSPFIEAVDRPIGAHREVGVGAGARLDGLHDRPGFRLIVAQLHGDVLARPAGRIVGIGEEDAVLPVEWPLAQANDAPHADRLDQGIVKMIAAPPGDSIGAA